MYSYFYLYFLGIVPNRHKVASLGAGVNPRGRSSTGDESPSYGLPTPSTPKWNSLLSHSKPAPPVSTSTPPVLTESNSRSRSRPRDLNGDDIAAPTIPMLPPRPAYPPPLPPIAKSTLQPDAAPFVPTPMPRRPSAAIVIKKPNGEEVDFKRLATSAVFAPAPSAAIKIESEAERAIRLGLQREESQTGDALDGPAIVTDEPEDLADGSQDDEPLEAEKSPATEEEESGQHLAIPVLATSPPTAPLDSGFPVIISAGPADVDVDAQPPQRERRERSRRSSNRADDLPNADGEIGLKKMTRTRSGRGGSNRNHTIINPDGTMTRTRSGAGERRRQPPGRLDLSGIPKPSVLNTGIIANAISNARMIPDVRKIVYPEQDGIFGPAKELNEGVEDGKFRCVSVP